MDGRTDRRKNPQEAQALHHFCCLFISSLQRSLSTCGKESNHKLIFCSSVHGLVSDKYTVFNSVHPIKGKCIVERMRGNKTEAEGIGHQIEKSKVPRNWAHGAGEEGNRQSSLAPWEQMEVLVLYWQCEACPREDGRGLRA